MNKYTDGKKTIHATEKAHRLLYKEQGFRPFTIDDMKVNELRDLAADKGIAGGDEMKKDGLIKALKGADEDDPTGTAETTG